VRYFPIRLLTGACPASPALWAGSRGTISNNKSLPGSPALCAGSFTLMGPVLKRKEDSIRGLGLHHSCSRASRLDAPPCRRGASHLFLRVLSNSLSGQRVDSRNGTSYFTERKKGVIRVRPMGQRRERLGTVLGVSVFEAA